MGDSVPLRPQSNPHYLPAARVTFSDVASAAVPVPTKRRCDRVLFYLRSADEPVTARDLVEHMRRNRLSDYSYPLCARDLARLEKFGLVRNAGHPKRWEAIGA